MRSPNYDLKMNVDALWKEILNFKVSKELCEYVVGAALGFEVWVTTGSTDVSENLTDEKKDADEGGAELDLTPSSVALTPRSSENEALKKENDELREKLALALRQIEILRAKSGDSGAEHQISCTPRTVMKLNMVRENDLVLNGKTV